MPEPPEDDRGPTTAEIPSFSPRLESLVVRPWSVHRARLARRWLIVLLVLAPVLATLASWWGLSGLDQRLVTDYRGIAADQWLELDATALAVDPDLGELTMRMVPFPRGRLISGDRLTEDVTLLVNDQSGPNLRTFEAGSVMEPMTIVVELTGNSTRYPFDTYRGFLSVGANTGESDSPEPLPTDLKLTAALPEFTMDAISDPADNSVRAEMDLGRRWSAITWVVLFMTISWAIALSCAGVTWWIVVFNATTPMWVYTLFAAVLFALPSLRIGLPGNPRYGVLVDWAAFYWAILVVAFSLVAVLAVWNVSARASFRDVLRQSAADESD